MFIAAFPLLLLAGHLIGDFVLQTRRTADGKKRISTLVRHGCEVLFAHLLLLWPFWSPRLLVGIALLVVAHVLVDVWKANRRNNLAAFSCDQLLHLVLLVVAWILVEPDSFTALGEQWPGIASSGWYVWSVLLLGMFGFALRGGGTVVRFALGPNLDRDENDPESPRGEKIGYLERTLILVLAIMGEWGSVGLILAAKSVARFRELDKRDFAEYYLIGTLASTLVAVLVGVAATIAARWCGIPGQ